MRSPERRICWIEYKNDTNAEMQEFNNLTELTKDNPAQQQRLKDLSACHEAVFDNDSKVMGFMQNKDPSRMQMDDTVESQDETETAVNDLEKFTDEEKKLLVKRDAAEQKDYHHAAHLLIGASILVAVLLVIANYVASREMERRRKAEAKQRGLIG